MKTKVFYTLAIVSMLSLNGFAQDLENKFYSGFYSSRSYTQQLRSDLQRNSEHESIHFSKTVHPLTVVTIKSKLPTKPLINVMTNNVEITKEQVELIFSRTKEFPEGTELSIAFINNEQVVYYGLKRENDTIINSSFGDKSPLLDSSTRLRLLWVPIDFLV